MSTLRKIGSFTYTPGQAYVPGVPEYCDTVLDYAALFVPSQSQALEGSSAGPAVIYVDLGSSTGYTSLGGDGHSI